MMVQFDPKLARAVAQAVRRENFLLFLQGAFNVISPGKTLSKDPYLEALAFALQFAALEHGKRLMVTMPPRYLKSIAASIALPAWMLGRDPSMKIIVACYADTLAKDHARLFRRLVASDFYRTAFPYTSVVPVVNNATEFVTCQGGGRRAATVGGSLTGMGADLIIIDDVMKASDASSDARREEARRFHDETLYTRLNDKVQGSIIVVQQRLHQDDLIAHLKERERYEHLNLPAIADQPSSMSLYNGFTWEREQGEFLAPEHEGQAALDAIKADIGEAAFITQYQQDPASSGSSMLDFGKVSLLDDDPQDIRALKIVQTWDTAIKDGPNCDFSVGITFAWDGDRWVVLDVIRRRMNFGALKAAALAFYKKWSPDLIVVEDSANGSAMVSDLRKDKDISIKLLSPKGSKEERFSIATEYLESGKLVLLRSAGYFSVLRQELLAFPEGRFDDQVDAISLLVRRVRLPRPIQKRGEGRKRRGSIC